MGRSVDYFSEDDARKAGMAMEPQEGRDFPKGSGIPMLTQQLTGSSTQTLARCVTIRCLCCKHCLVHYIYRQPYA